MYHIEGSIKIAASLHEGDKVSLGPCPCIPPPLSHSEELRGGGSTIVKCSSTHKQGHFPDWIFLYCILCDSLSLHLVGPGRALAERARAGVLLLQLENLVLAKIEHLLTNFCMINRSKIQEKILFFGKLLF